MKVIKIIKLKLIAFHSDKILNFILIMDENKRYNIIIIKCHKHNGRNPQQKS